MQFLIIYPIDQVTRDWLKKFFVMRDLITKFSVMYDWNCSDLIPQDNNMYKQINSNTSCSEVAKKSEVDDSISTFVEVTC